jgi:hypothetical protein
VDERRLRLANNLERIRSFRSEFKEFEQAIPLLKRSLPPLLTELYVDCQSFAESEIKLRLNDFLSLYRSASTHTTTLS